MNCDRHGLTKSLIEMDAVPVGKKNGGKLYKMRDLIQAYAGGDEKAERIRKTRAEAQRIEIQNLRSQGELVEVEKVKRLGENIMMAVRNKILAMPMTDAEKDSCFLELLSLKDADWSR